MKYSDLLFNAFGGNEEGLRGLIQVFLFFFLFLSFSLASCVLFWNLFGIGCDRMAFSLLWKS